jgi:Glycosyl hydrolase catalytic core
MHHMRQIFCLTVVALLAWSLQSSGRAQTPSTPAWASAKPGNVFEVDEAVELPLKVQADNVYWQVTDFWHNPVDLGNNVVVNGAVTIKPKTSAIGYYLIHVTPQSASGAGPGFYTSFAIVRPHASSDPLNSPFGAMTHFAQGMSTDVLPLLKKIGICSNRDEHYWANIEQVKGVYQFSENEDAYMKVCHDNGINPLVELTFGNKLYDDAAGPSTPTGYEGYSHYAQAILKHYGNQIHWLEVWNEYNGSWQPPAARSDVAKYYAEMLKAAYAGIKAVRPDVQVLGAAAVLIPLPYFEGIFKNGGLDAMDAVVIHPYREKPEGVDQEVAALQDLIRKYNNGRDKPVWVTETGRYTQNEYDWEKGRKMYEMGRADGARYLPRQFTLLLKQKVARIYWYLASDHQNFAGMGLLRNYGDEPSGMGRLAVAPSYVSYANLIRQLEGAEYVKQEANLAYTPVHVYLFHRGDDNIRVCWATHPASIKLKTAKPLTVSNIMGGETTVTPVNGVVKLDLNEDTIYVHGSVTGVSEVPTSDHVIASSTYDYGNTQGLNNWSYGYIDGPEIGTGDGDTPSVFYTDDKFREFKQVQTAWGYEWAGVPDCQFLKISQGTMHPGQTGGHDVAPVLRWKSPVNGKITISGFWDNEGSGMGVRANVMVDGKLLYSQKLGGKDAKRVEFSVPAAIKKGSLVDFYLLPKANLAYDATGFEFVLKLKR